MSDRPEVRTSGITISPGQDLVEAAVAVRGRSDAWSGEDSVIGAEVDRWGGLDTFGLTDTRTISVPSSLGPTTLLVQDLSTGRWRWELGMSTGAARRFEVAVPSETSDPGTSRGDEAAKLLVKVVGATGGDKVLGSAGQFAVEQWERRYRPSAIVWFRRNDGLGAAPPAQSSELEGRSVLLLHDVFGSTLSSFGDLPRDARRWLESNYDGRVWGFDHATLASDPAKNARRLIELVGASCPPMTVDILAHGRGGLVAAALAARPGDLPFKLGTVAVIGSPLGGSPIYDTKQLVAFANRYTNLLSFTPDNPFATTLDAVVAFVSQLATGATSDLVGLAACAAGIPGALPKGVTWRIVAGEYPAKELWAGRLRDDLLDGLLPEPNDLFVSVASAAPTDVGAEVLTAVSAHHRELVPAVPVDALLGPSVQSSTPSTAVPGPQRESVAQKDVPSATGMQTATASTAGTGPRRFHRRDAATPATVIAPLEVSVAHGAIEMCDDTVLVGHFLGMEITGAEAALDGRLRGRLATRQLARLYPEVIGESLHVANGASVGGTGSPTDVIVVGLGDPGELSRTLLTRTVTAGLLRFALDRAQGFRLDGIEEVRVSSAMMGLAGPAPLVVTDSVVAIVEGVVGANARLRELPDVNGRPLSGRIRFSRLRLVQLHADVAEVGAHVVARIHDYLQDRGTGVVAAGSQRLSEGGDGGWPPRLATDDDPGWYRVVVEGPPPEPGRRQSLRFIGLDRRARADQLTVSPNPAVVKRLTERAISEQSQPAAAALFEQLVPVALRGPMATEGNLQFIVDDVSAQYPWEALIPGRGNEGEGALGRRALIRQFTGTEGARGRVRTGNARVAVVIGNPPSDFKPLPSAYAEAGRVIDLLLRAAFDVTKCLWEPSDPVWNPPRDLSGEIAEALGTPHCRVLHIAAHGQMDTNPDASGVVIGPGSFLTSDDIAQRSEVPELVFLNCCELADHVGLASNLANAFMCAGAQAVVAAGWEVSDAAADQFATRFYRDMLSGATFGAAVRDAREASYRAMPTGMTWAAYQCYGDPGFRLEPRRRLSISFPDMVSATELLRQIEVIGVRAGSVGRRRGEPTAVHQRRLLAELTTLAERAAEDDSTKKWLDSRAYAALGNAAAELGDLQKAVDWYGLAVQADKALGPMTSLEQLGNLEIRLAQQLHRQGGATEALADSAKVHLDRALEVWPTFERHSLIGSYYKKRATLRLAGDQPRDLLAESIKSYQAAAKLAPKEAYPVCIWLQLSALWGTPPAPDEARAALEATEENSIDPDGGFRQRAALGDNRLTRVLVGLEPGSLTFEGESMADAPERRIVDAYVHALEARSTWRERSSVLEHLRDLIDLTDPGTKVGGDLLVANFLQGVLADVVTWIRKNLEQDE